MFKSASFVLATVLVSQKTSQVLGHGYMETPRSRNYHAFWLTTPYGSGSCEGSAGCPPAEYCHHCLNANDGVCGKTTSRSFETSDWLDKNGAPMPWEAQATYTEGDVITITSYLSTHHNGHMQLAACVVDDSDPTSCTTPQEFEPSGNQLEFVRDLVATQNYDPPMPKDDNYSERGYYAGGQSGGIANFAMDFKLPMGIVGDKVLLQWRYITANSCSPPGYADYFAKSELAGKDSYWTTGLQTCTVPYPNDGNRDLSTNPEQFWNCAEVAILPFGTAAPTVSSEPTKAPVTSSPTTSMKPTKAPVVGGPPACLAQWTDCTYDWANCCDGLQCRQVNEAGYGRCLMLDTCGNPSPAPTPNPTNVPTPNPTPNPNGATSQPTPGPTSGPTPNPTSPTPPSGSCCYDRNSGYQECFESADCSLSTADCDNCGGKILSAPHVRTGCCSWGSDCTNDQGNLGCHYMQSDCEGDCQGTWQTFE